MKTSAARSNTPIALADVRVTGGFWASRIRQIAEQVIPHQWDVLNDRIPGAEKSHAVENFRIASGRSHGKFHGMRFQDSDVAKWIEAASYSLHAVRRPETERAIEEAVDLIAAAQGPDGYVNTFFSIAEPGKRWTDFSHGHELYCAGHLAEAAVAHLEATGNRTLLTVMERYLDYIESVIGPGDGQLRAYSGHPEIELALARVYRVTGEEKHLQFLRYLIEERGRQPSFLSKEPTFGYVYKDRWFDLSYHQAHSPIREQQTADGHAVRAMYLFASVADLVLETGDRSFEQALERLWKSVTSARMYVTGGVGSHAHGERLSLDFDLPNERAYSESCASIGLIFWAHRMLQIRPRGQLGDVLERALYNCVLAGISLSGTEYFYSNPLAVVPSEVRAREDLKHVATQRQKWFGIACCPTNIARLIGSVGSYVYSVGEDIAFIHLYVESEAALQLGGRRVHMRQRTGYPWTESVRIDVDPDTGADFTLAVRIPSWCHLPTATLNGTPLPDLPQLMREGYLHIRRTWTAGDSLEIGFSLHVERIAADPRVAADRGRIALQRGPVVYCLEEVDNGVNLADLFIPPEVSLDTHHRQDFLGGVVTISGEAGRGGSRPANGELYGPAVTVRTRTRFTAVPYFAWSNRTPGEMTVWLRES